MDAVVISTLITYNAKAELCSLSKLVDALDGADGGGASTSVAAAQACAGRARLQLRLSELRAWSE